MKRLLWLFTMLICFSFAGFSNTTIDLTNNSNKDKELVSCSDVVQSVVGVASADLKVVLGNTSNFEVSTLLKDARIYTTRSISLIHTSKANTDIAICIRDKIRML